METLEYDVVMWCSSLRRQQQTPDDSEDRKFSERVTTAGLFSCCSLNLSISVWIHKCIQSIKHQKINLSEYSWSSPYAHKFLSARRRVVFKNHLKVPVFMCWHVSLRGSCRHIFTPHYLRMTRKLTLVKVLQVRRQNCISLWAFIAVTLLYYSVFAFMWLKIRKQNVKTQFVQAEQNESKQQGIKMWV